MSKLSYAPRLFRNIVAFAKREKVYWIVPLTIILAIAAMLVVVSQGAAPLIYAIF